MKVEVVKKHLGEGVFKTYVKGTKVDILEDCKHFIHWKKCKLENEITYVPGCFVEDSKLKYDYNPTEIVSDEGDTIEVIYIVYAWIYGKNLVSGETGWIPCENVCSSNFNF